MLTLSRPRDEKRRGEGLSSLKPSIGCGLSGSLLVLETTLGRRLEATDVALNSGGEAPIIRGETQD